MSNKVVLVRLLVLGLIIAACRPGAAHAQIISAAQSPWVSQDIGSAALGGESVFSNDQFTVSAGGAFMSDASDQFHFVYQRLSGDVKITARLDSLTPAHVWSHAGLMIRSSLQPDAAQVSVLVTGDGGPALRSRGETGGLATSLSGHVTASAPQWLGLERVASRVTAYSSSDGTTWTVIGSESLELSQDVYVGIAVTGYDAGESALASLSQVSVGGLPAGMHHGDIGGLAGRGNAWHTRRTYTVTSGSAAAPDTQDQFHFVYRRMQGDADVAARVVSLTDVNRRAKAGVMIRESLAADSRNAAVLISSENGYAFDRRADTGGLTEHTDGGPGGVPGWVRLVRRGENFEAFRSNDGVAWTSMGSAQIAMSEQVYVGLAVQSQDAAIEAAAVLDDVSVGPVLGAVSAAPVRDTRNAASMAGVSDLTQTVTLPVIAAVAPPLGAAAAFGVLGNSAVTGAAGSGVIVSGDVGSSPTPAISGFPPSRTAAPFTIHTLNDSVVQQAHTDAIAAYSALLIQGPGTVISDDLGTVGALTSGVYSFTGVAPALPAGATLTLNGPGVFVFNVPTSLTANVNSVVAGTANPCNIFWRVGTSATLNGVNFRGTVIANVSITLGAASNLEGRLLAGAGATGAVTMAGAGGNTIGGCSTAQNQAPTVALTSPANGATFTAPATITLTAAASDPENELARVEFYQGSTLLGTDTSSPYSFAWPSVPAGSYTLTAIAFDAIGGQTTSSAVSITVQGANQPPSVALTSPANGATFTAPATIDLAASASDPENQLQRVEFYRDGTLLGTDTASPFSYTWSSAPAGSYTLTAVAFDGDAGQTTSAAVSITVNPNQPPTVSLTSPANGATFTAPATITMTALAADPENRLARVEFYRDGTLLGADSSSPYSFTWSSVAAGSYTLTAKAFDSDTGQTTSAAVSITVNLNQPPTVSLTSPANGATFMAPATVTLTASASDPENRLARVEFYQGSTLLGTNTSSPYSFTWSSVPAGSYTLTAKAFDSDGGQTTSSAVTITVGTAPPPPPRLAVFTASADHDDNVTSYRLEVFTSGADPETATPIASSDLGTPTPDANREITVDRSSFFSALAPGNYTATVTAIGSGGNARSTPVAFSR